MFIANVMVQSDYLKSEKMSWSEEDDSIQQFVFDSKTIYSGKTVYYGDNPPPTDSPFYSQFQNASNTIDSSTPTFSSGTETNVAYESVTPIGYEEYPKYKQQLDRIEDAKRRGTLPADSSNYLTQDQVKDIEKDAKIKISGLTYYNIYRGDGWRFKPRGYLYITGRREYFDYNNWAYGLNSNINVLNQPEIIENEFEESFNVAIYNWIFKKPKDQKTLNIYPNSYEAAGGNGTNKDREGTSSDFTLTNEISCQGVTIKNSFDAFESVLSAFDLKDDNNP